MSRRGRGHTGGDHELGRELNLVPYLDIMVNLVLFMLVNIVSFLSFTILNASIPQLNTGPASEAQAQAKGEELLLVMYVYENSILIAPSVTNGKPIPKKSFEKVKAQGSDEKVYNFAGINAYLGTIKSRFPKEEKILITSKPDISYESIIQAMDAARETDSGLEDLFPEVTLSI
ncbi:MAG: biopolymer transporter ExbD [Bdellovibrionota bacterium]|nr:biopolymer transporter ExbD [Deltaproteobacteria bacterium]